MAEYLSAFLDFFHDFIIWLFSTPFIGELTAGYLFLGIDVVAIIGYFFLHRFK